VKKKEFSAQDERHIMTEFEKRFRDEFRVQLHAVDSIPRTSRGKYQFLVQKLQFDSMKK